MIVVSDELARDGGSPRSQLELARGLAAKGIDVDLVYLREGAWLESWKRIARRRLPIAYRPPAPTPSRVAGTRRLIRNARAALATAPRLGRRRREVVLARGHEEIFSAAVIAVARRVPLVLHLCSLPPKDALSAFELGDRLAFRSVARFFAVAEHLAERWARIGIGRETIDVVHTGLDLERWKPLESGGDALRAELGIEPFAPVVLHAGRFDPTKGLAVLAEACAELRARRPALRLVAVGAGGEAAAGEADLLATARGLLAGEAFVVLPRVDDVRRCYAMADVVAVPSLLAEPFSRVVLEALACGRPVVASDVGGNREALVDELAEWLYPPTDGAALAARLDSAIDRRRAEADLPARCRAHVAERFTLDRAVAGALATLSAARSRPRRSAAGCAG